MNPVVVIPTFIYPRRHRGGADVVSTYDHPTAPNQEGELGRCLESLAKVEGLGLVVILVSADVSLEVQAAEKVQAIANRHPDVTTLVIGAAELAKMKPDAILINTARGGLIDENALLDALEAGRLCGAGIDAFSSEPPKDPRWFTLDNVVLGSHCAASTAGASRNMGRMATANLIHDLGL